MQRITTGPQHQRKSVGKPGLLNGDQSAWRRFHAQYDRLIYRCIRKVTHSFS